MRTDGKKVNPEYYDLWILFSRLKVIGLVAEHLHMSVNEVNEYLTPECIEQFAVIIDEVEIWLSQHS